MNISDPYRNIVRTSDAVEARIARKRAAQKWFQEYVGKHLTVDATPNDPIAKALRVIVLTNGTRNYLAENDPQALKQAQIALDGTSWEDYIGK